VVERFLFVSGQNCRGCGFGLAVQAEKISELVPCSAHWTARYKWQGKQDSYGDGCK